MARLKEQSGTWFDPRVVEILERRYIELESLAQMKEDTVSLTVFRKQRAWSAASRPRQDSNGRNPTTALTDNSDFLSLIASARQEAQTMFELSQDLGVSLSLSETLSVLSMRLRRMIPYDSIAVFVNRNGWLLPELVSGENFRMLSSLKIRVGEGLVRLGRGKLQADRQRQSPSGSRIRRRSRESTRRCNRRWSCRWKA